MDPAIRKELAIPDIEEIDIFKTDTRTDITVDEFLTEAQAADKFCQEIIQQLKNGAQRSAKISLADCTVVSSRLLQYRDKYWVPHNDGLQLRLIQEAHDSPASGHPGVAKTMELLGRTYY